MINMQRGTGHSAGGGHCGPTKTDKSSWKKEIEGLNVLRKSPFVMQSNMDFSIGGSISANCHGWQYAAQPIGTYCEFFVDQGNGPQRPSNALKSAVIGGYGLCGQIVNPTFETIPNYTVMSTVSTGPAEDFVGRTDYACGLQNTTSNKQES